MPKRTPNSDNKRRKKGLKSSSLSRTSTVKPSRMVPIRIGRTAKSRPVKATSPRKAGKKRSHDFALTMRKNISDNWVELKKKIN